MGLRCRKVDKPCCSQCICWPGTGYVCGKTEHTTGSAGAMMEGSMHFYEVGECRFPESIGCFGISECKVLSVQSLNCSKASKGKFSIVACICEGYLTLEPQCSPHGHCTGHRLESVRGIHRCLGHTLAFLRDVLQLPLCL